MQAIKTPLSGAVIIEPKVYGDSRGWFLESFSYFKLENLGIKMEVVQANRSFSAREGTLRGLHCQTEPMAQAKLITCIKGAIMDVAVDIREGSPSYMKWVKVELSAENKKMFYIPRGFLHGFLTLTEDVEVEYKVDQYYSQDDDRSIRFDDKAIGINWGIEEPVLYDKDRNAPLLKDSGISFRYYI